MRMLLACALLVVACVDVAPAPAPLEAGDGVRISGGKVSLDPAIKLPNCTEGQILRRGASGWLCADPGGAAVDSTKTPVLTGCSAGQLISWSGEQWACVAPPTPGGAAVDPTKTPVLTGCAQGGVVTWDGAKWACPVPPSTGDLAGRVSTLETRMAGIAATTYETRTATKSAVAPGDCLAITHNFHTNAVGYAGWLSDPVAGWVSAQQTRAPGRDLAAWADTSASAGTTPEAANDGYFDSRWQTPWVQGTTWWQVDLGSSKPLGFVRLATGYLTSHISAGVNAWDIYVSDTTVFPATPAARGTCLWDFGCRTPTTSPFPPGTHGRYVRFVPTGLSSGSPNISLTIFEVYPPTDPIVLVSADELRLCNITDTARDLVLRVWK